jgi:hypothetical protein
MQHLRIILVGLGCTLAVSAVKNKTDELSLPQRQYANSIQTFVRQPPRLQGLGSTDFLSTTLSPGSQATRLLGGRSTNGADAVAPPVTRRRQAPMTDPNVDWTEMLKRWQTNSGLQSLDSVPSTPGFPERVLRESQNLLHEPRHTVSAWADPWRSIGNTVLDLAEGVVKLGSLVLIVLSVGVGAFLCLAGVAWLYAAMAPVVKRTYAAIVRDPAPFRTVMSAGVGSGFGLLLGMAFIDLWDETAGRMFLDLGVMALVAAGAILFIEPLTERVLSRVARDDEQQDEAAGHNLPRGYLGWAALGFLMAISHMADGLLHHTISEKPTDSAILLATSFLIPASITSAWIIGARSASPGRAARLGAATGLLLGAGPVLLILLFAAGDLQVTGLPTWLISLRNGLQWGIAGLFGGLALDGHFGSRPVRAAAVAVIGVLVGTSVFSHNFTSGDELSVIFLQDLPRALGWAGGLLIVEPFARGCLSSAYRPPRTMPASG